MAHVKTVLVGVQSAAFATEGGIHHIYANDKALEGYDTGKFPDGSVIVYDLLETREVAGNTIEGPTRRVDVMVKQAPALNLDGRLGIYELPGRQPDWREADRRAKSNLCWLPRE